MEASGASRRTVAGLLAGGSVAAAPPERPKLHRRNPGGVVFPVVGRRRPDPHAPPDRFATGIRTKEAIAAANPRAPEPWTGRGVPRGRDNDAEKARLQRHMELHGKETLPPPRRLSEMARDGRELEPTPPRRKTRVQEMEEMFSAIVGEIEEREEFLAEMRELGRADRYEREIAAEVAERVNQLKGLDEALRSASGLS